MFKMPGKTSPKYITLKEASQISGYSPDYLGQLIRKGKLEGKQVYLNVAWMTTEDAVRDYLARSRGVGSGKTGFAEGIRTKLRQWTVNLSSGDTVIRLARRVIYFFIIVLLLFCAFVAYALIANLVHTLHL